MSSAAVPDVIAVGETMMMVTPARAESLATAEHMLLHPGGAESNVACHLAKLGVSSAWVSILGADVLGDRVLRAVSDHGVDTRWVQRTADAPTGVYFKDPGRGVLYYRSGSAASTMSPETVAAVPLEQAAVVQLSGITPALSAGCAALVDAIFDRAGDAAPLVSFDVNYRPALWASGAAPETLRTLANRADIVFVGLDEAAALWGCRAAADVRDVLPAPGRVVVKDGDVGATEFSMAGGDAENGCFEPAIPTEVLEAVGAGDAFAAGYLAALLAGRGPRERLRAAHERARLVLRSTSDFLIEAELDALAAAEAASLAARTTQGTS